MLYDVVSYHTGFRCHGYGTWSLEIREVLKKLPPWVAFLDSSSKLPEFDRLNAGVDNPDPIESKDHDPYATKYKAVATARMCYTLHA